MTFEDRADLLRRLLREPETVEADNVLRAKQQWAWMRGRDYMDVLSVLRQESARRVLRVQRSERTS